MSIVLESAVITSYAIGNPIRTGLIYKTFGFSAIEIWNYVEANVPINSSYTFFQELN